MLKKVSQSFQNQNPIVQFGEIMNRNFGAFVRLFRREPALLAVFLAPGLWMRIELEQVIAGCWRLVAGDAVA